MTKSFICIVLSIIAVATTLTIAGSAWCSETPYPECVIKQASKADVTEAKKAWQIGTEAFSEARYDDAVMNCETAFKHDCTATLLLFQLSRAYEGAGNLEQSVVALQAYVDRFSKEVEPGDKDLEQMSKRLVALKLKRDQRQPVAQAQPAIQPQFAPQEQRVPRRDNVTPTSSTTTASAKVTVNASASTKKSSWLPTALIVTGGAAALAGGGIFTYGYFQQKNAAEKCANYLCSDHSLTDQGNNGRNVAYVGSIVAIGGVGIAVTGIVWSIVDHKSSKGEQPKVAQVSPTVSPSFAGVQLNGSF